MNASDTIRYTDEHASELGIDPTDPRWRELVEEHDLAEASSPATIPACPPWCELPAGHECDSTEMHFVTHVRYHSLVGQRHRGEPARRCGRCAARAGRSD